MSSLLLLLAALPCTSALRYLVLRHGQTNHNRDGIIQGSSDVSVLTDAGVAQAQDAGAAIAQLTDLTSPNPSPSPSPGPSPSPSPNPIPNPNLTLT